MNFNNIIFESIEEFNKTQKEFEIEKKLDFILIGNGSLLDSLAAVNFLTRLEKKIFKKLNKEIDLINKVFAIKKNKISINDLIIFLKNSIKK